LKYCHNFFGINHFMITADQPIPTGEHQVRMEFAYDGGGLAKGGDVTLYYDDKAVGKGRVEMTEPMVYSADEACDVGFDSGSPTSPGYGPTGNHFTGDIISNSSNAAPRCTPRPARPRFSLMNFQGAQSRNCLRVQRDELAGRPRRCDARRA
jgi:hypothetical protein